MSIISELASSQYLTSKHWGYRDGTEIYYIIPHHMAGKLSGAVCAQYFVRNGLDNSANYCIGFDGDISCNVPEEYGAWTSSFSLADKHAITIEVSDIANGGDYRIPAAAQEALIKLMVDLIQRYPSLGGKAVFDPTDESEVVAAKRAYRNIHCDGNVLLHKWTAAYGTTCPEWHMIQILPEICAEVNRRLAGESGSGGTTPTKTNREIAQQVIEGRWGNGDERIYALTKYGYNATEVQKEVNLMLAKDTQSNLETLIDTLGTIQKGDACTEVLILQKILQHMGYLTVEPDGIFGNYTEAALKQFQQNISTVYGSFAVDGICGVQTWKRMLIG